MNIARYFIFAIALPCLVFAQEPSKPSVVPEQFRWVHSIELEGFVGKEDRTQQGVQNGRFRLRYLDPNVNAFIGMQTSLTHFNRGLALEDPSDPKTGHILMDMGAHIGLIRGRHLWALELMGVTAAGKLAGAAAIVGEHRLVSQMHLYHRWQVDAFVGDGIFDADQGFFWNVTPSTGLKIGYRIFSTMHSNHNHAHVGLRWRFKNPKIPFIFPSVG